METTIRRATETNFRYRLVNEDDLVAGLEVLFIPHDVQIDPTISPKFFASEIRLDDNPVRDTEFGRYVYYHFFYPQHWKDLQCFVSLEEFTGQYDRQQNDFRSQYWMPL